MRQHYQTSPMDAPIKLRRLDKADRTRSKPVKQRDNARRSARKAKRVG